MKLKVKIFGFTIIVNLPFKVTETKSSISSKLFQIVALARFSACEQNEKFIIEISKFQYFIIAIHSDTQP
jgi:hypothetical protein